MGNSMGVQEFSAYIDSFGSDILETLYSYIDERLDTYVGEDDIDNLDIAFKYLERVLLNTEYDRELSNYRIGKLYQKINRIGVERNKKFANVDAAPEAQVNDVYDDRLTDADLKDKEIKFINLDHISMMGVLDFKKLQENFNLEEDLFKKIFGDS